MPVLLIYRCAATVPGYDDVIVVQAGEPRRGRIMSFGLGGIRTIHYSEQNHWDDEGVEQPFLCTIRNDAKITKNTYHEAFLRWWLKQHANRAPGYFF